MQLASELARPVASALLAAAVFFAGGCSAHPARTSAAPHVSAAASVPPAPAPQPVEDTRDAAAGVSWLFEPRLEWIPQARRTTPEGVLYFGRERQRWLVREGAAPVASQLDPDDVTGALPRSNGWLFISDAARIYAADGPLSPLIPRSDGLGARAARAGKEHFVAIFDAALHFSSDGGQRWQPSEAPKHAELRALAMLETGLGVALAGERELLVTRDDGRSFTRARVTLERKQVLELSTTGDELRALTYRAPSGLDEFVVVEAERGVAARQVRSWRLGPLTRSWDEGLFAIREVADTPRSLGFGLRSDPEGGRRTQISLVPFGSPPRFTSAPLLDGCAVADATTGDLCTVAWCGQPEVQRLVYFQGATLRSQTLPVKLSPEHLRVERLSKTEFVLAAPCGAEPALTLFDAEAGSFKNPSETPCRHHLGFGTAEGAEAPLSVALSPAGISAHAWQRGRPELLGSVLAGDVPELISASIVRAPSGAILVALELIGYRARLFRSAKPGAPFHELALPHPSVWRIALTGRRGLLFGVETEVRACPGHTCSEAFETNDEGQSWHRVDIPRSARPFILQCVPEGCGTSLGYRKGWALP